MDTWKFYDIIHKFHLVMNPTSEDKLSRLVRLLRLPRGAHVVDIGCGKGEFLVRLAQVYEVVGTGVDISPYCIADARRRQHEQVPSASLNFLQADAAGTSLEPGSADLASCIGASWIFGGYRATLKVLLGMVVDGGWVIVGEPYWRAEPVPDYLDISGFQRDNFGTHAENATAGDEFGLHLVHAFVSSPDDWDEYEGLQWYAAEQYSRTHYDDPDVPELIERVARHKMAFLRWGRDTLGWAMYVFRDGRRS